VLVYYKDASFDSPPWVLWGAMLFSEKLTIGLKSRFVVVDSVESLSQKMSELE
jgi:hypothetical protein